MASAGSERRRGHRLGGQQGCPNPRVGIAPPGTGRLQQNLLVILSLASLWTAACAPARSTPTAASPQAVGSPAPTAGPGAAPPTVDDSAVADFYRGKTVRFVVALPAGGGLDTVSRLLAKHMRRFIPGNPNVIVENRVGAAGLLTANAVYATEPKDGTVVGGFVDGIPLKQVLGEEGVQYDAARFQWLGAAVKTTAACAVRSDLGISGIQQIMDGKEVILGVTGPGTTTNDTPRILDATLGTRFKLVTGYPGSPEIQLAIERKEVDGFCLDMFAFEGNFRHTLEGNPALLKLIVLLSGDAADSALTRGVPVAETLVKTDEDRALIRTVRVPQVMSKPFAVAPEVPSARAAALRAALAQTFADQEFLDEAQKANQLITPSSGEEVTRVVQEVLATPPATLAQLREILK